MLCNTQRRFINATQRSVSSCTAHATHLLHCILLKEAKARPPCMHSMLIHPAAMAKCRLKADTFRWPVVRLWPARPKPFHSAIISGLDISKKREVQVQLVPGV